MSEESELEKTEPPSARRLEKAREEGQVARSRELSTFALLLAGVGGLLATAGSTADHLMRSIHSAMQFDRASAFDTSHMLMRSGQIWYEAISALLPVFVLLMVAACVAPMLLGGWLFSTNQIAFKFSKLNPLEGLKRLFSTQSLAELFKAICKAGLVGIVGWILVSRAMDQMINLMMMPVHQALVQSLQMVGHWCLIVTCSLVLVAALDVPYQLWSFNRRLRMSREDLKQEQKESDGDPHIKAKIRQQQQAMARRRMMSEVATADVVLTNPTHFAVALKYVDKEMRAPRVVAKGTDLIAARIRELGLEHKVPVLEAPPLTRALYRHTRLGQEIPSGLYTAVAEVLAWVFQLQRWREDERARQRPETPRDLYVPEELQVAGEAIVPDALDSEQTLD